MKKHKTQQWKAGDLFTIRLIDGSYVIGQILDDTAIPNSVSCVFFDLRVATDAPETPIEIDQEDVIAVAAVVASHLDQGAWHVFGNRRVALVRDDWPNESTRKSGWVGSKVRTGAIIEDFLNAYYALAPWDQYHDPHYMDKMLFSPSKKPPKLMYKRAEKE